MKKYVLFLALIMLCSIVSANDYYMAVDDSSSSTDVVMMTRMRNEMMSDMGDDYSVKLNSEISKGNLDNRITLFIHNRRALIIVGDNSDSEQVVVAAKMSNLFKSIYGNDAFTKKSSEITHDDLTEEFGSLPTLESALDEDFDSGETAVSVSDVQPSRIALEEEMETSVSSQSVSRCRCTFSSEDQKAYVEMLQKHKLAKDEGNEHDADEIEGELRTLKENMHQYCECESGSESVSGDEVANRNRLVKSTNVEIDYCKYLLSLKEKREHYENIDTSIYSSKGMTDEEIRDDIENTLERLDNNIGEYHIRCYGKDETEDSAPVEQGGDSMSGSEGISALRAKISEAEASSSDSPAVFKPVAPENIDEVRQYYDGKIEEAVIESMFADSAVPDETGNVQTPITEGFDEDIAELVAEAVDAQDEVLFEEMADMVDEMIINKEEIIVGSNKINSRQKKIRTLLGNKYFVIDKENERVTLKIEEGDAAEITVESELKLEGDSMYVGNNEIHKIPKVLKQERIQDIVLETDKGKAVYRITDKKEYKVLGLFKKHTVDELEIDAETGEQISETNRPWWGGISSKDNEIAFEMENVG